MDDEDVLHLLPTVARAVLDHALETRPDEACGILLGPQPRRAHEVLRARNVHANPRTRYEIDPASLLEAHERADAEGLEIVGFYHSHPRGAAAFSEEDEARGAWEGASYLLISLSPLTYVAGRWEGEGFEELLVAIQGQYAGR